MIQEFNNLIICFNVRLSNVRPDLLEPISFGSEVRLLALEQELQELREQVSAIVKSNKQSRCMYTYDKYLFFIYIINLFQLESYLDTSTASLSNGVDSENIIQSQQPPPPPPPPLPPPTPHIARRASLQDHKVEDRKRGPFASQTSMTDVLKDIDNVKLKPVAR